MFFSSCSTTIKSTCYRNKEDSRQFLKQTNIYIFLHRHPLNSKGFFRSVSKEGKKKNRIILNLSYYKKMLRNTYYYNSCSIVKPQHSKFVQETYGISSVTCVEANTPYNFTKRSKLYELRLLFRVWKCVCL